MISADSGTICAALRAHVDLVEVVRVDAVLGVGLQHHPPHAAELAELPGDRRAEEALHRLERVLHRHAEHLGLVAVEVDEQLLASTPRKVVLTPASSGPLRAPWRGTPAPPALGGARVARAAVLDVELEAAGRAEARDRRRVDREDEALLERGELRGSAAAAR